MEITVKIEGLREVASALRELPKRIDRKILNEGLMAGANLVRDEARALAPVLSQPDPRWRPGALRQAIQSARIAASRAQYAGEVIVRVRKLSLRQVSAFKRKQRANGQKASSRLNPDDAYYWAFIEFGTSKIGAKPFMRPAFENRKDQAVQVAIKVFQERIQTEIDKLGRSLGGA